MRRLLAAGVGIATSFAAPLPGDWLLERVPGAQHYQLTLTRHDTLVDARRVAQVTGESLRGLNPASFEQPKAAVRFEWVRNAGVFEFQGFVEKGRASGRFWFQADPMFQAALRDRVESWWEPGLLFDFAVAGASLQAALQQRAAQPSSREPWPPAQEIPRFEPGVRSHPLRALKDAGYILSKDEALRLQKQGVQPDLLRQMKLSGYDALSVSDMLRLQTHGVTPQDVRQFELRRGPGLSVDDIVRLKTNGID